MRLETTRVERMQCVFAAVPEVAAVFLFGSQAEGRARADSDVDLALVPAAGKNLRARKLDILAALARQGVTDVDLVVLDRHDVVLSHEAIRMNRLLYARPDFDRGSFYSKMIREYFDFQPYLKVQREALKARLAYGAP